MMMSQRACLISKERKKKEEDGRLAFASTSTNRSETIARESLLFPILI
jgi:hypothetical protein